MSIEVRKPTPEETARNEAVPDLGEGTVPSSRGTTTKRRPV